MHHIIKLCTWSSNLYARRCSRVAVEWSLIDSWCNSKSGRLASSPPRLVLLDSRLVSLLLSDVLRTTLYSPILSCWSIQTPIDLTIVTKHFTDSNRNVKSCTGVNVVVEPGGGPRAVFRRPFTVLQTSDGINNV